MAKKHARKVHRHAKATVAKVRPVKRNDDTLVVVRGWMFVVAFALMLGIGAIVGTYFNTLMGGTPMVAGASVER